MAEDRVIKVCATCKEAKPHSEYHSRLASPDCLNYYCKSCVRERMREYYQRMRGRQIAKAHAYRRSEAGKERRRLWRQDYAPRHAQQNRLKRHVMGNPESGFTQAQRDERLEIQGGNCAICRKPPERVCGDHCHATGKKRGVLCSKCNLMIGHANDDPRILAAAMQYLAFWKVA